MAKCLNIHIHALPEAITSAAATSQTDILETKTVKKNISSVSVLWDESEGFSYKERLLTVRESEIKSSGQNEDIFFF